jgi:hypothetical protein
MQNIEHLQELRYDEIVLAPGEREGDELRGHTHFHAVFSSGARRCQAVVRRLCSFTVFVVGLGTLGCATTHATLNITAPSTVTAGIPFTITVTAVYEGNRDTAINSVVQFTSSDSAAIIPGLYQFTAEDAGSHTWAGVVLKTPGSQTITATMVMEAGINGTATFTVSPSGTGAQFYRNALDPD